MQAELKIASSLVDLRGKGATARDSVASLDGDGNSLLKVSSFQLLPRDTCYPPPQVIDEFQTAGSPSPKGFKSKWHKMMCLSQAGVLRCFGSFSLGSCRTCGLGRVSDMRRGERVCDCDIPGQAAPTCPWNQRNSIWALSVIAFQTLRFVGGLNARPL